MGADVRGRNPRRTRRPRHDDVARPRGSPLPRRPGQPGPHRGDGRQRVRQRRPRAAADHPAHLDHLQLRGAVGRDVAQHPDLPARLRPGRDRMNWVQAVVTIAVANVIVLVPMLLNSHAGTKYGIPYPVFARASFGLRGANLPAVLRALIACAWLGIQTWIGGEGFYTLIGAIAGHGWTAATPAIGGFPWTQWLSFAIFWVLEMAIIVRGMDTLRRFENWAAPFVLVAAVVLLVYMITKAHGFGAVLSQPARLGWGSRFWPVFFSSLMAMIAFWSTMSLNMPDFTRFGRGQRQQAFGQALGLPTTMTFFSLLAVLITAASQKIYGAPIWDPIQLTGKFHSPVAIAFALFTIVVATLSVNVAANTVSPSYDFSNLAPKLVSFRTGGLITGVIGIAIQPWRL